MSRSENKNSRGRQRLGRGLSALMGDIQDEYVKEDSSRNATRVRIDLLAPSPFQPRQHFDEDSISDLVESVREKGILQPLLVRPDPARTGYYEIIAGERRWRAAQMAKIHDVPVLVKEFSDQEVLEVALVENLQRQDLSPLEEAEGYKRLMEEFRHTQEDLAKAVGKSRSHVANMMRLLTLPASVKTMLEGENLSIGHARALLNTEQPEKLAQEVVKKGLNVRQTENLARKGEAPKSRPRRKKTDKDVDTLALERDISNLLGLKVSIRFHGRGGNISIEYESLEQLDDILLRLSQGQNPSAESETEDDGDMLGYVIERDAFSRRDEDAAGETF